VNCTDVENSCSPLNIHVHRSSVNNHITA